MEDGCKHEHCKKIGKDRHGVQRYKCLDCGKRFVQQAPKPLGNMRIEKAQAVMVLRMMLEGSSIRTIERLTGVNRNTIMDLLVLVGERCERLMNRRMRNIPATDVQCDELWAFVGCKEKFRKLANRSEELGDSYTFIAIDRETKLVLTYQIGKRDPYNAKIFAIRLRNAINCEPCQITTDGFGPYTNCIPLAMIEKPDVSYAQLVKIYGKDSGKAEARYSPSPIVGIKKYAVWGNPDEDRVCTSHIERLNLSVRMGIRRFTRLTNAFSKSPRNHEAAVGLWLVFYNFCRVHQTLKATPAVKAGLASETWTVERMLDELATAA